MKRLDKTGFTIVELMIATLVFSVVLLVLTAGVIGISKSFYKGFVTSKTQETARSIVDEIGQAIQFSGGNINTHVTNSDVASGYCINSRLYSYVLYKPVSAGNHRLISSPYSCNNGAITALSGAGMNSGTAGYRELLGANMRVAKFIVAEVPSNPNLYTVSVKVVYAADDDVLANPNTANALCKSEIGSQFCAISEITTTVQRRIATGP